MAQQDGTHGVGDLRHPLLGDGRPLIPEPIEDARTHEARGMVGSSWDHVEVDVWVEGMLRELRDVGLHGTVNLGERL